MGPGTWPLKVHICCVTPGATSSSVSVAWKVTLWTVARSAGRKVGSNARQSGPGAALKSIVASVEADGDEAGVGETVAGEAAVAAALPTCSVPTMPAASWPGTWQ